MKALSLWQPHATLLVTPYPATGVPFKLHETRAWPAPTSLIGQRIAIHAARNTTDMRWVSDCWEDEDPAWPIDEIIAAIRSLGFTSPQALPLGSIVGTAILKACHRTETLTDPGPFGDFSEGRWAWEMAQVRPLTAPVPFRGLQGVFDVPDDLLRERAQALASQGKDAEGLT